MRHLQQAFQRRLCPSYTVMRRGRKNDWDKLEAEVKKEEKEEKPEGEQALQKLFREIYSSSDEDTRRAMNKSYQVGPLPQCYTDTASAAHKEAETGTGSGCPDTSRYIVAKAAQSCLGISCRENDLGIETV